MKCRERLLLGESSHVACPKRAPALSQLADFIAVVSKEVREKGSPIVRDNPMVAYPENRSYAQGSFALTRRLAEHTADPPDGTLPLAESWPSSHDEDVVLRCLLLPAQHGKASPFAPRPYLLGGEPMCLWRSFII